MISIAALSLVVALLAFDKWIDLKKYRLELEHGF